MKIRFRIENLLQLLTDICYAIIPQPEPALSDLQNCKIISHRGDHNNKNIKENTLAAFEKAMQIGAWGVECDVRWSKDLQPVVIHDSDCLRVFGENLVVNQLTLDELQTSIPEIPSLVQVVQRFGRKLHLMVELKKEKFSDPGYQRSCLRELFSSLNPGKDFHILALDLDLFELVDFIPNEAKLPVAEFNIGEFSKRALQENYAGLSGQYLLLTKQLIQKHRNSNQKAGTGFIGSRFCFYRELNRRVEWIFTDDALKLCSIRQKLLVRLARK